MPDRVVLQSTVEGWFLECDAHALGEGLAEQHPDQRSRLGQARAFYRDWVAATWVENVNIEKGVAVPTRAVVEEMDTGTVAGAADGWACRRRLQRLSQGERAWACRWRKRVGAYVCRPSTHEVLPVAEMREKAGGKSRCRRPFFFNPWVHFWSPKLRPENGHQIRSEMHETL